MNFVKEFKELCKETGTFFVFDTETTGLNPENSDVIEFAGVKVIVEGGKGLVTEEVDFFIDPGYPLPSDITELTGITDEDVKSGLDKKAAYEKIKGFFGDSSVIAGYNVGFDIKFIAKLFSENGDEFKFKSSLDVLKMAREKLPKPHKLINVCDALGVSEKYQFHRAIDDAKATTDVLFKLLPEYENVEEGILTIAGLTRWSKYGFDRVYVNNKQKASVFYDVTEDTWNIPSDYDESTTIKAVLEYAGVEKAQELVSIA